MIRIDIDKRAVANLKNLPDVKEGQHTVALVIARLARLSAPRRQGHYVNGIEALAASVVARDFKSHWIEFGAGPSPVRGGKPFPAHHTMQRAAEASPGKFTVSKRRFT